jgi:hypothetical protein
MNYQLYTAVRTGCHSRLGSFRVINIVLVFKEKHIVPLWQFHLN